MTETTQRPSLPAIETGTLIAGVWHRGETFAVDDPFTGETIAQFPAVTPELLDRAVEVAAAADSIPPATRSDILRRAADLLEERRADFVVLLGLEVGFPPSDSHKEIDRSQVTLRLCAEEALRLTGEPVAFGSSPGHESRIGATRRFPLGVVCAITPFNSPLNVVIHKIGPALAGGNAVVLKPSPLAPMTPALLAQTLLDAGLPPALLAVVNGADDSAGRALLADPRIAFYAFTGSTAVGRLVAAGAGIRRSQLELGSIASTIVCESADLSKALPKIATAAFRKAGQVCTSTQRLYVHRSRYEETVGGLVELANSIVSGDPFDPSVTLGPLITTAATDRVMKSIEDAIGSGGQLLAGGQREGSVIRPTVLADVTPNQSALCAEMFGPVVSAIPFDDLEDAVAGANATDFGLSCGVFAEDLGSVRAAMDSLRFGAVHLNEASSARADEMPFGGVKASGRGFEGPRWAIREMTEERLHTWTP
ncbi:aldehyde dehydrogenase family protein [Jatrophihabitans sp. DSM 45814]